MEIKGKHLISAPPEEVWKALNDPVVLGKCIPGLETLDKNSETEFAATVTTKVGPVKAKFAGRVTLSELDPPRGYRITGEGQGGVAGFAKGTCVVILSESEGKTDLSYQAEAQVGGKLAQIGSRMVLGVAKKTADDFFGAFAATVGNERQSFEEELNSNEKTTGMAKQEKADAVGLKPGIWIGGLIAVVAILWWFSS